MLDKVDDCKKIDLAVIAREFAKLIMKLPLKVTS